MKLDNTPAHSRWDPDLDYVIECPRHIRILPYGGARRTYYEQDWSGRESFWLVFDIREDRPFYLPTIQAQLKLNIFGDEGSCLNRLRKLAKTKELYLDRYLIQKISKINFLRNGGQPKKLCWKYKEEVTDREERLEEIRSRRYRPVPLAKYEAGAIQERTDEADVPLPEGGEFSNFFD